MGLRGPKRVTDFQQYIKDRVKVDKNGCWIWQRAILRSGYGVVALTDQPRLAHRLSYLHFKGELNPMDVLQMCGVRSCINPEHLYQGTHSVWGARRFICSECKKLINQGAETVKNSEQNFRKI